MNDGLKLRDVVIVGAGAAGLMSAVSAKRLGLDVLLLDSKEKIGAKILMSGGTRCNITNENVLESDFETEQKRILRGILQSFSSEQALSFFEDIGVECVLESGGKYFPATHSGRTVLEAFLKELKRIEVPVQTGARVTGIQFEDSLFKISGENFLHSARAVILTTGGLSFPSTGSDGGGYELAKVFGHTLVATSPSLTPLKTQAKVWQTLTGISLPVRLSLWVDGKRRESYEGDFLFTHFGFSGPVVLNISRHWIRRPADVPVKLVANFMPAMNEEDFRNKLMNESSWSPSKPLRFFMTAFFPARLAEALLYKAGLVGETPLNQLKREAREDLIRLIRHCPLEITGDMGYAKAEVTAGGVNLLEVKPVTLESKKQPGLFFAGEILDVDGRIGGFNFQWAWASGYAAAQGVFEKLGQKHA